MILLHGGLTNGMLWSILGLYFFFVGIPVYMALFFSLKHTALYLNKVRNKGALLNISYSIAVLFLAIISLVVLGVCFIFFQVI